MRKIFGPECFGAEGDPFPVMFGAADSYRKILGSSVDPAKKRGWKGIVKLQAVMPSITNLPVGTSPSGKSLSGYKESRRMKNGRIVVEEWHGSTCGIST
jgi:hypothetical protein